MMKGNLLPLLSIFAQPSTLTFEIRYFSTKTLLMFWVMPDFLSLAANVAISTQTNVKVGQSF